MADDDTDRFVINQLAPALADKVIELHGTVQWTDLMNMMHLELYKLGFRNDDITKAVRNIAFSPSMIETIHLATSSNAEIIILSDSNSVYIDEVLQEHNIRENITRVITNPAWFDVNKGLHVQRLTTDPPHGCPIGCAVNICKGKELLDHIASSGAYERIVYIGDGRNDFCPATKLSSNDVVLPRQNRGFAKLLTNPAYRDRIVAEVTLWDTAEDLLSVFKRLFAERPSEVKP
ncbi:hypothetical protein HK104_004419 [Borealophlyctis nickersoniae]|nr:hypothetical protein HK104_004419 [Borealophlyctis nickersoniae]